MMMILLSLISSLKFIPQEEEPNLTENWLISPTNAGLSLLNKNNFGWVNSSINILGMFGLIILLTHLSLSLPPPYGSLWC
jgi:hypothetical protein